ncbi:hypothetical protein J2Z52_000511, partial [Enterococcus rivorum]|nr:hypothetical protein [Enterococcus rivorum]
QRSSSSVFLLLSILPPDKVKDFLKTAKLLAKGEHSMDAIKLSAKEWQILKDFEKSADTLKVIKKTSKANIGKDFGKIGIYVEKPNVKINWSEHAVHGMERLNQRGLTKLQVDDFIQNGKVLSQNNGAKFAFITEDGVAIVSKDGKLVTAWGVSDFDDGMKEIVKQLFGK